MMENCLLKLHIYLKETNYCANKLAQHHCVSIAWSSYAPAVSGHIVNLGGSLLFLGYFNNPVLYEYILFLKPIAEMQNAIHN